MAARLTAFIVIAIVAATVIAGVIAGARRDEGGNGATLIIHNARIPAGGDPPGFAEALAVQGDRIVRVGSNRDILRLRRPRTVEIDAHGATVLPDPRGSPDDDAEGVEQMEVLAAVSFESPSNGAVRPGMPADLLLLEVGLRGQAGPAPPDSWLKLTIADGTIVYDARTVE